MKKRKRIKILLATIFVSISGMALLFYPGATSATEATAIDGGVSSGEFKIRTQDSEASGNVVGGNVVIQAGDGNGSGDGGDIILTTGSGGSTGSEGNVGIGTTTPAYPLQMSLMTD